MPIAHMHHVVQDAEGFMWYATDGGVCRDNGYQIDVFRNEYSNPNFWKSNLIRGLAVGIDDKIWVATSEGLYYIDKADYSLKEVVAEEIPKKSIGFITVTSDGNIWVLGRKSIVKLSKDGELIKHYEASNRGDGYKSVNQIFEDSKHNIWLLECRGALSKYNAATDRFDRCDWPDDCEPHGGLFEDKTNGCFWVPTWGKGIVKYVPDETGIHGKVDFQPCTYEGNTLNSNMGKIVSMCSSADGKTLWCAAMDGFYAYTVGDDGVLRERSLQGLIPEGKNVYATVYRDRNENIWVTAYSPRPFILTQRNNDICRVPIDNVFYETGVETITENIVFDGNYAWIWHLRLNLMLYNTVDNDVNIVLQDEHKDYGSSVMCKKKNGEGIWSSSGWSLCELKHDGMNVKSSKLVNAGGVIRSIYDDGKGKVYVGTTYGVKCYDVTTGNLSDVLDNTGTVSKLLVDAVSNRLFFISERYGFASYSFADKKVKSYSEKLPERFESFDISDKGVICASTDVGSVYRIDVERGEVIRESDMSLPNSDEIFNLTFDSSGHLWLMTSQFVKEYNPENKSSRYIYASDKNIDLDYFISLTRVDDRICVGGAGGYCLLKSSETLDVKSVSAIPIVSSVIVDGEKSLIGKDMHDLVVEYGKMNVSVNFTILDYLHANKISYAYCLHKKGTKAEKWVYLPQGHNTAYFVDMQKGNYVLDVKATDVYGNWCEPVTCLNVEMLPAWWNTWWMYIVYFLIFASALILAIRVYYNYKVKNLEIQKLVNLAKELRESQQQNAENEEKEKEKPVIVEMTKAEQRFVATAKAKVEENISNSNYTTEDFASDMCMSRMNLYRKLQKVTGQKPTEFIRMIRLQYAAKLLKDGELSIAEISEKVGFSTPSYFTKCFKDAFGVLPTRYI
ncbi:MAG: helix-turn-helix domain-containing protein [Bacteroidaceae bacterium]|nr:helix-turn-helix domain-containing protein [Bacteroidaceae bacterium]